MRTNEDILNALRIIKSVCEENYQCKSCPFYDDNNEHCIPQSKPPAEYEILNGEPVWRAIK